MPAECESCKEKILQLLAGVTDTDKEKVSTFQKWEKNMDGQINRVRHTMTIESSLKELEESYKKVLRHCLAPISILPKGHLNCAIG